MNIAICDDELLYTKQIQKMIYDWAKKHDPICIHTHSYYSAEDLLDDWENGKTFDALFLDIMFPYMSGFDLATRIRATDSTVPIIFITSTERYALKGYEVSAYRYIKKPTSYEDICLCLDHCYAQINSPLQKSFILQRRGESTRIAFRDVLYLVSGIHSVTIYTADGEKTTTSLSTSFEKFVQQFPSDHFVRCHRGYAINMTHTKKYTQNTITMVGGHDIPVGRNYKEDALEKLRNYFLHEVQL